jgi:endonuclease/exonuclease/phosphatase family metal-dependent hydrolase
MVVRALSWNLFHGRDHPPDPSLNTLRSRLLGIAERNETHVQVNHSLRDEFAGLLAAGDWHLALLQEAPPRWLRALCRTAGADGVSALTARNGMAALRGWLADRNPDLLGSWEGGSNQLLVRPPWRIVETRRLWLTHHPEGRRMLWARLAAPAETLCVANLHAAAHDRAAAGRQVTRAAERAVEWAGGDPLVFGGDLNLRPATSPGVFDRLHERLGLGPPLAPASVDHLMVRGLELRSPPSALPAGAREVPGPEGRVIRLSDHALVVMQADTAA